MCGHIAEVDTHVNTLSYKQLIVVQPLDREESLCKPPLPTTLIHQFHISLLCHPPHKGSLLTMMFCPCLIRLLHKYPLWNSSPHHPFIKIFWNCSFRVPCS